MTNVQQHQAFHNPCCCFFCFISQVYAATHDLTLEYKERKKGIKNLGFLAFVAIRKKGRRNDILETVGKYSLRQKKRHEDGDDKQKASWTAGEYQT